jgi:hypothetical protein
MSLRLLILTFTVVSARTVFYTKTGFLQLDISAIILREHILKIYYMIDSFRRYNFLIERFREKSLFGKISYSKYRRSESLTKTSRILVRVYITASLSLPPSPDI